jgi:hypothetical protein
MEINSQRYELAQNGRKYILTTEIHGDYVRLTCVETGVHNPLIYLGEFSLVQLRQFCSVFNSMTVISQAQELLNKTIESQKVSVEPKGNFLNIVLYLTTESEEEDSFSLRMGVNNPQNLNYNQPVVYPPVTQQTSTTVTDQYISTGSTNQDFGNTIYPTNIPVELNTNLPSFENTTTTTTTEQVYSTPLENTTTTTTNDIYSIPMENTTTTTTNEMYTIPMENTTTTTTNDIYSIPMENTTTTTTNEMYSIPMENTTTTTTNEMYSIPIENATTTTTTNEVYSTPLENTTTTTTTNDINYQNYDNTQYQNIQSYDNVQNYDNLNMNGGNQMQTDVYKTTTTKKVDTVTLPLAPSANEVPQNNNQDLNNYFTDYSQPREQIH